MGSSFIEFDLKTLTPTLLCSLVVLLILSYFSSRKWPFLQKDHKHKATAPEASGGWPIVGHLPLLRGPEPPHRTLGAMADRTGPVFTIRVGSHRWLVVNSSESAKECFTTNDLVLASRPDDMLAVKHLSYGNAMFGIASYGPFWRDIRKIAVSELLSHGRLEMLSHVRVSEVAAFVKELYRHCSTNRGDPKSGPVLVEMKERLWDLALNVILRMVAGKRYSTNPKGGDIKESRLVQKAISDFFFLVGSFVPGDAIPWLKWLDFGGYEKAMKKTAKVLDGFLGEWLEEHKRKRELDESSEAKKDSDFMDVMISVLQNSDKSGHNSDTINKATCLNIILGGSDTIAVTLTWAISLLLNNRHTLRKAQDELDRHVGKTRPVEESDISKLQYLHAILKETLRLYPAAPLSASHFCTSDCTVGGFHVPRGTRLITNIWKIQTDPEFWPDPMEFRPERFLTTHRDVDVWGQDFELIPFGSGRRSCAGSLFALQILRLTLARFLQAFEITTPSDSDVDLTESIGMTNMKATPLEVLVSPRLLPELYD